MLIVDYREASHSIYHNLLVIRNEPLPNSIIEEYIS